MQSKKTKEMTHDEYIKERAQKQQFLVEEIIN